MKVIKIEGIAKKYELGTFGTGSLKSDFQRWWARKTNSIDPTLKIGEFEKKKSSKDYWALKDINFDINQGETVAIIGKNGAGKSTLLKILSRITAPTKGDIFVKGRIASLLEVGTGFHAELSGRENIFLNGAILGMSKSEIRTKFDEIVDFSGIEKFIDTPVKRYSSGMYVRLAFAVAAHLEPEILIVDEVLAVGDAEFQKKCLGKMQDVAGHGRTVLFVSHNMAAVSNLCNKAIILKQGMVDFPISNTQEAIQHYLANSLEDAKINLEDREDRSGQGNIRMTKIEILDKNESGIEHAISGQYIKFKIYYKSKINATNVSVAVAITRSDGFLMTVLCNEIASEPFKKIGSEGFFSCDIEKLPLMAGTYLFNLMIEQNGVMEDWIVQGGTLLVENGDYYGTGRVVESSHNSILLDQKWTVN